MTDRLPAKTRAEIQSGLDRLRYAEGLILQLPGSHDGRNTWLLNYGISEEAAALRREIGMGWDVRTQSAAPVQKPEPIPEPAAVTMKEIVHSAPD